jgi:hypothetical protein
MICGDDDRDRASVSRELEICATTPTVRMRMQAFRGIICGRCQCNSTTSHIFTFAVRHILQKRCQRAQRASMHDDRRH